MKLVVSPAEAWRTGREQVEALAALPETVVILNRSLRNFATTVARLDRLVQRVDRLTEPLEQPLAALAPRLEALLPLLDEDLLASLPDMLLVLQKSGLPALEMIGQTQTQVASIVASVDRLMTVLDDTVSRIADLPGVTLVSRLRGGAPRSLHPSDKPRPGADD